MNQRFGLRLVLAGVVIGVSCAAWLHSSVGRTAPAAAGDELPAPTKLQLQGVASCASMACHNGNGPRGEKGSEYTTWITYDPHAKAFAVLMNERSQRIWKNLSADQRGTDKGPEQADICLRCHSNYVEKAAWEKNPRLSPIDGVGCESCHGPAEKWLSTHYKDNWSKQSPDEKAKFGLIPTKNLTARAEVCTACHIGSADADVNHDLIAAGHPRLNFEFGAYHANLPRHWSDQKDKAGRPDFEVQAWAIGQVVSARAALDLLAARADGASKSGDASKPWPEFAEYNCFACHHDVADPSWRQKLWSLRDDKPRRKPGTIPWGDWYFAMPLAMETIAPQYRLGEIEKSVAALRDLMEQPYPDAGKAKSQAEALSAQLKKWQARNEKPDAASVRAALRNLAQRGPELAAPSWDHAAQVYLATAALYHGLNDLDPGSRNPELKAAFKELSKDSYLVFPQGFDSPRQQFNPQSFKALLDKIHQQLGK